VNAQRQFSLLDNIHQVASSKLDFLARAGLHVRQAAPARNDNNSFGVVSSGFLGRPHRQSGYGFLTPSQSYSIRTFQ